MKKEKLLDLLSQMTLEEKIGQLVQVAGEVFLMDNVDTTTGPLKELNLSNKMLYNVGSILNVVGSEKIRKIQDEYLSKNRLKIPLLFMADVINGYRTVFPIPLAQGWASFILEVNNYLSFLKNREMIATVREKQNKKNRILRWQSQGVSLKYYKV